MKKIISGKVIKISGLKTVKVQSVFNMKHKKYHKMINITRNYMAHDEKQIFKVGDKINIIECRPLSAKKNFIVIYND